MDESVLSKKHKAALKYAVINGLQKAFDDTVLKKKKEIGFKSNDLKEACYRIDLGEEYQDIVAQ